ncbi:hypothetical protein CTI12_AA066190 [Artemisia annua]|uniref:Uncharacterized protein n=1 Tax=Artemisia annua TaxID=35608 RepID=A0A2U1Q780_ARTAN|nr:hypothetical protein CTI12_AA066190 [Artemisia annua]
MNKGSKASASSEPEHVERIGFVMEVGSPKQVSHRVSYKGSGGEKDTYETKSYRSYNDKQTGSYGRATKTKTASAGEFQWKNGTSGTRSEYKQTETRRYGDKNGYTEVYNEQRFRNVSYDNNYRSKNVVTYDYGDSDDDSDYGGGYCDGYGYDDDDDSDY